MAVGEGRKFFKLLIPILLILIAGALMLAMSCLVKAGRAINFPPPESVSIEQYQLTGAKVSPNMRVDEKLYFDRDSFSSIFLRRDF